MTKKSSYKSNRGVTLIALANTIVLMMILAGVTIKLAQNSDETARNVKEESKNIETITETSGNDLLTMQEKVDEENFVNSETSSSNITTIIGDNKLIEINGKKIKVTKPGETTEVEITGNTEQTKKVLSDVYGTKVKYESDSSSNTAINNKTWRIFFIDFTGTYSGNNIGTVYLKADFDSSETVNPYNYTDDSYLPIISNASNIQNKMNKTWWQKRGKILHISSSDTKTVTANSNEKQTAYLCNPDQFKRFKNNNANWAIASPSMGIYFASYNSVNHPTVETTQSNYSLREAMSSNYYGYIYHRASGELSENINSTSPNSIDYKGYHSMYCGSNKTQGNYNWWLSSPYYLSSSTSYTEMPYINGSTSEATYSQSTDQSYGICPLVSIKNGVSLEIIDEND